MTTTSSNNFTSLYGSDGSSATAGTAYGNANVVSLLATSTDGANTIGNISATGNVTADYFIGDGSLLTNINAGNIVGSYGNANVAAYLASGTNSSNIVTSANVSGSFILGNGSQLTGLPATYSNAQVSSYLASGTNSANIITSANISGQYFLGNGSQLTGLPATYGNANVAAYLPTNTANVQAGNLSVTGSQVTQGTISATGNITTAGYFVGNFAGNITGNISVPGSNTQVLFNNQGNVGAVGGLTYDKDANALGVLGTVSAQGNVTGGNILTGGVVSAGGNVRGANLNTAGNVTGTYIIGNGSTLSNITGANVSGTVADATHATVADSANAVAGANVTGTVASATLATFATTANAVAGANVSGTVASAAQANIANTANSVSGSNVSGAVANAVYATSAGTASTVTANAQPNITSVGTLTSLSASGNITGSYFIGNGSQLTGVVGTYGNTEVRDYLASGTNTANIVTSGNISGSYILGNGSQLTGLPAGYSNAQVASYLASGTNSSNIITSANISGAYVLGNGSQLTGVVATAIGTLPSLSVTGNIDAGNVNSTFYGNGAGLTNITGGNVTGTVASASLAQYVTANAQANITSVGTLTSMSVSGNINGSNVNASTVQATTSAGLALKNSAGTTQASMGAGGGDNFAISVSTNINGNNAQVDISPTGTGHVHIKPAGSGAVEIAPTSPGSINNMIIGNVTPAAVSATTVSASGSVTGANLVATAGYVFAPSSDLRLYPAAGSNVIMQGPVGGANLSVNGNITGSYFLGNGSQLTGLPAGYSNADVATFLAAFGSNAISTTGNVTAGYFVGNGSLLTSLTGANVSGTVANATYATSAGTATSATTAGTVTANAQANITSVGTLTSLSVSGNTTSGNLLTAGVMSATGNVSGNYFIGNGSQLTGITGSYGNANVTALMAAFGSNTISTTGNITSGNLITGGASGNITGVNYVNANYFVGNGALLTGIANLTQIVNGTSNISIPSTNGVANVVIAGAVKATFSSTTLSANSAISASGNIDGANIIAASDVTANGNIAGVNLNLSGGIEAVGSNMNIATISATGNVRVGALTTAATPSSSGNVTVAGSISVAGNAALSTTTAATLSTTGNISSAGNITANYFLGNGSQLTGLASSYGNANVSDFLANGFGSNTISTTGTVSAGTLSSAGNVFAANVLLNGALVNIYGGNGSIAASTVSTTGNITGAYFLGNGSQLTGLPNTAPGGSNTQVQFNDGSVFSGNANLTFDKVTGNFTAGNIVTVGSVINNKNAWSYTPANTLLSINNSRIVVGNAWDGNAAVQYDPSNITRGSRLAVIDKQTFDYTANINQPGTRLVSGYLVADLAGSTIGAASPTRLSGGSFVVNIGNGTSSSTALFGVAGQQNGVLIGNASSTSTGALGNATVTQASGQNSLVAVYNGSTVLNGVGMVSQVLASQAGATIGNSIGYGYARSDVANSLSTWNIGYYHAGPTTFASMAQSGNARLSTNYYAFYNADNFADVQLGSLRSFHYYTSNVLATGGSQAISKANGPYQTTTGVLTANLDITSFTNFVTSNTVTAGTNTGTKLSSDVVTLMIPMGATPYSINMPGGNTSIYYTTGSNVVTGTANSLVQLQITGGNIGGSVRYLVNVANVAVNV